ncbi:Hypothetical protein DEACI_2163 [Acididesulfobacillus acetoxydans]|uniref:Uncharacterized protein n=1 Tax=Acididesulfobacillus acetoxydans TaxID=1561005 RepID=A0A8S0XBQ3_9FIRM|nr:Hypothetical protein DEACI_2163 [Acididesulfobacillus acetoxydans]CEJ06983.1 Hypothetical protein DEACI_1437 [Acididesulfobacillus acetoxydans]
MQSDREGFKRGGSRSSGRTRRNRKEECGSSGTSRIPERRAKGLEKEVLIRDCFTRVPNHTKVRTSISNDARKGDVVDDS